MARSWEDPFTCPRCGATSHHPIDAHEGYCAACHEWTDPPAVGGVPWHPTHFDRAGQPITLLRWAELREDSDYVRIAHDPIVHDVDAASVWWLSTVWLGLDMSFAVHPGVPPLIYETMLFGMPDEYEAEHQTQWRWHSEVEALAGHDQVLMEVRASVG